MDLTSAKSSGFMYTTDFESGISVLITESAFTEDLFYERKALPNFEFFILRVHDTAIKSTSTKPNEDTSGAVDLARSMVHLTTSMVNTSYFLPADTKTRAVNIVFDKQFLMETLGIDCAEKFMTIFFSFYIKKSFVAQVDADYRAIINELTSDLNAHPLKQAFVYNRIMLILEKFLIKFITIDHQNKKTIQLKDGEISRLVKAEMLLLKDFSVTPPTIEMLSKICAMSPTKFKNDFKSLYGLPIYEYYQKHRMMHARSLILQSKYAIKEVGMMVGYSNLGHFAASFKKEFGVLPRELMNANQFTRYEHEDQPENLSMAK